MMALQVDTKTIALAVEQITKENVAIDNELNTVIAAVDLLSQNWIGAASDRCNDACKAIENVYKLDRCNVLQSFVSLLYHQVAGGYETLETKIVSAADSFK